jgi:Tfp pilus assembly protein PilW
MKLLLPNQISPRRTTAHAFTVAEMLISFWIFSFLIVAAMVAVQIFGLRMYTLAATKLSATEGCRKTMNVIRDQIREANFIDVGMCTSTPSAFNSLSTSVSQQGNAVKVYPTVYTNVYCPSYNTNVYSLFYLDMQSNTNDWQMTQYTVASNAANNGFVTNITVLAGYITNQDIFTAADYQGNPLTNELSWDKREVISIKLQFYQWEYPIANVGTNAGVDNMYDSYQLRTRVTQRAY